MKNNSVNGRVNKFFVVGVALLVVFVFLVMGAIDGLARIRAKKTIAERDAVVAKIGDYSFSVSDLELFCAMVVEGDSYAEIKRTSHGDDDLNSAVKSKALLYMRQYASVCQEAAAAEISLTSVESFEATENTKLDNSGKTLTGDALDKYYHENYGVSYNRYLEIKLGFVLCEKYINLKAEEISYSEDEMKMIFNDNIDQMAWATCDLIFIPLSSKDEGVNQLKIFTAEKVVKELNNCDESSVYSLWNEYYSTYNEAGFSNSRDNTIVYGSSNELYPELFNAICDENVTGFNAIVSGGAVFIVRANERHLYDYFKDSTALSELVFEAACDEVLSKIIRKAKYNPITTNAYLKFVFEYLGK